MMLAPWKESYDQPRKHIKKQRHYFVNKVLSSQGYGFSSSHVWMWELDHKESWAPKNWWFWTVVMEKTLESPLACKEIQPVNTKGNQSWIFIGRTEAEVPILWTPYMKNGLIGKDPDAGKVWRQEEKGTTEHEMAGWHHQLDGQEFEQALGVGDGQGRLAGCSPWGCKEADTTKRLNWTAFLQDSCQLFYGCGWLILCQCYLKMHIVGEGPGATLSVLQLVNRFFQWSCMDLRVGLWRNLGAKKLMLLNSGVGQDSWQFLGLQGDPTSPS